MKCVKEIPRLLYGTAWKKERTGDLVLQALESGFPGIDTAGMPKHYNQRSAGEGLLRWYQASGKTREDVFIQTKFSPVNRADPQSVRDAPFDPKAAWDKQVHQSAAASLVDLSTNYLDCYVLHSPAPTKEANLLIWKGFEELVAEGTVHSLGISNIYDPSLLEFMWNTATVKPRVVQNRFYPATNYDKEIREFCLAHDITYQSFWTLTANWPVIERIATTEGGFTAEQMFFRYVMDLGVSPLSGTTSPDHMRQDVAVLQMDSLNAQQSKDIEILLLKYVQGHFAQSH